jgi:hypothetical protein
MKMQAVEFRWIMSHSRGSCLDSESTPLPASQLPGARHPELPSAARRACHKVGSSAVLRECVCLSNFSPTQPAKAGTKWPNSWSNPLNGG